MLQKETYGYRKKINCKIAEYIFDVDRDVVEDTGIRGKRSQIKMTIKEIQKMMINY